MSMHVMPQIANFALGITCKVTKKFLFRRNLHYFP